MSTVDNVKNSVIELLRATRNELVTPAYIYSVEQVGLNYKDLKEALGTPLVVSIKSNHCPELLSRAAYHFEDGYEVASLGELRLRSGTKQKVYINTPAYSKKMVEVASRYNATFIVDHLAQLDVIAEVKQERDFNNDVLLRLNFDAVVKGAAAYPDDHFGMDLPALRAAIAKVIDIGIKVSGLHIFAGSNNFLKKSQACVAAVEGLYDLVSEMLGYPLAVINLGGGIPANWREKNIDFKSYRDALSGLQQKATVIHESGRAIFGTAGYFLTEVVSTKSINEKNIIVCDGGMAQNFLLAKTEHVIRKYDTPFVFSDKAGEAKNYIFVGSSCNRDDVIGEAKSCKNNIDIGDKVLFENCGAYNSMYTVSKFLALKEYKEYVI
ncbi:alanine racemase [Rheinheimera maricola]|uniref:Alanine racemase n=1 Tax=Rheinheimera maricola TaxID=2793282 RepID=A0ABS7XCS9_9GAMM|nr:alanine racemase [Rheinheimera maricola]MBZ9613161.1 alanine racemase [Rheinheimera maricola]